MDIYVRFFNQPIFKLENTERVVGMFYLKKRPSFLTPNLSPIQL